MNEREREKWAEQKKGIKKSLQEGFRMVVDQVFIWDLQGNCKIYENCVCLLYKHYWSKGCWCQTALCIFLPLVKESSLTSVTFDLLTWINTRELIHKIQHLSFPAFSFSQYQQTLNLIIRQMPTKCFLSPASYVWNITMATLKHSMCWNPASPWRKPTSGGT